ncbi:AlpA family transcriptional regulator [Microbacterium sp. C7(2022)]|uniref:helix-turn-helix transcriptional regulator n=1 Tax=Microbacterium sp. C7(2022) TaxID=2992759 RepID=UPI00237A35FC|nr:hypothetical protein [Microbacterium sp. C7(2022)]MDE0547095.1 hypothetical protein [Microbacterium sp. C7(2022)]
MPTDRPEVMTVADVAARFGVSESTVRVWLTHRDAGATGGVPSVLPAPLARGVVWLAADIEEIAPIVEARSRKGGRPRATPEPADVESGASGSTEAGKDGTP